MADPIISPDGKFIWTGTEWIPAPPNPSQSANVSLQDSVIGGDVTITQNNAEDIAAAMVTALERLGFTGQSSPAELTSAQEAEVEQVLEMSEQLASHGIEIDPWTEIRLGNAADIAGRTHTAQQHFLRALETFRKNGDRRGEATSLNNLGIISQTRGDLAEAERLQRESLAIKREIGDQKGIADSLNNIGTLANTRGNLAEAERLYRESLAIEREIGNQGGIATSLNNIGVIARKKGNYTEAERLQRENRSICEERGDRSGLSTAVQNLGAIAESLGNLADAERLYRESLAINREIGNRESEALALHGLGNVAAKNGNVDELNKRMDIIPVSIALAQAAKESGWGTSRFALEGNAIFGQWTWNGRGIEPLLKDKSKSHKILRFPILRASVKAYQNNLNTHRSYSKFREKRKNLRADKKKITGLELAKTLGSYAQTGTEYTKILAKIITQNRLMDFELVRLVNSQKREELDL